MTALREPQLTVGWVLLTMGDRPAELARAIDSIRAHDPQVRIVVVFNGVPAADGLGPGITCIELPENLGVAAARDVAMRELDADVVCFLDDDAVVLDDVQEAALHVMVDQADVGVVAFRLVDEFGVTSRRHVPRLGLRGYDAEGPVPTFLGGACAIRRTAYLAVGGYFGDLFYGHEELDLAWRLQDAGFRILYLAHQRVFHPRTDIARHPRGWWYTGRNRVWVARRNLPMLVLVPHVLFWLVAGAVRAPQGCRAAYIRGWFQGWSRQHNLVRRPISWRTVAALTRLGRPPLV